MRTLSIMSLVITSLSCLTMVCEAQVVDAELPAEAKERLDHIIGRWKFETQHLKQDGSVRSTVEGTEEAKYAIDGRVVEMTTTLNGQTSKSWMFYNIAEEQFYLTSVDARGDLWILSGGLDEYVITSRPKRRANGSELTIRFTHSNVKADSFEALMETSIDGGETWWTRSRQYLTRVND